LTTTHYYSGSGRWFFIEIQAEGMQLAIADGSNCLLSLGRYLA